MIDSDIARPRAVRKPTTVYDPGAMLRILEFEDVDACARTAAAPARKPTRPRLPRYVNVFNDRHGKQRSYFRHAGIRVALHGEIGSPEWFQEYTDALAGRPTA